MDLLITNLVEGELESNFATFSHPENEDEDHGELTFDLPVYNSTIGKYEVRNISGFDVQGTAISTLTLVDEEDELSPSDRLNPTKVFLWIVKKIKGVLCPSCM